MALTASSKVRQMALPLAGVLLALGLFFILRLDLITTAIVSLAQHEDVEIAAFIFATLRSGIFRLQLITLVMLVACVILAAQTRQPALPKLFTHPAIPLSVVALIVGIAAIFQNSYVVNGTRYFVLFDDAMISMRYARNWVNGLGLVWNAGEYVEGYSNFLWVVGMALIHLLRLPDHDTASLVILMNWLLNVGLLWLIQSILRRLGVNLFWLWLCLLCFLVDINVIFWANSGLESPLLAFLVTLCVWALLDKRQLVFLIALSLIPLVRSDAFVLATGLGLWFLWQQRFRPRFILWLLVASLPALAQLIFRNVYYGDWLPNTYYLKSTGIELLSLYGIRYGFRFFITYGLLCIPLFIGIFVVPKLRGIILVCLIQIVYFILIGGDAFQFLRFAVPVLPLIYLGAVACLQKIASRQDKSAQFALAAYFIIATPLLGDVFSFPNNAVRGQTELGVLIEVNTPPDTLVAISAAGAAPYFAEQQRFIDVLGKTDAHIAHLRPPNNLGVLGHNKFDFDYVYQVRQPEVLATNASCEWAEDLLSTQSVSGWPTVFQNLPHNQDIHSYFEILNTSFVNQYFSDQVTIEVPGQRGCLYLRAGSLLSRHWNFN